jgi:aryl-alcohol dehydrogenase-like predicted oxidoreductase
MKTDATHRSLGKTGQVNFIVGLGGVTMMEMDREEAIQLGHKAVDEGVTLFDVSPTYGDAQAKMGPVVRERRKEIFLACKTGVRNAQGARAELKESLRLLQTDYIDLYQFHNLGPEQLEQVTAKGGAMEVFLEARQAGLVRHLGVTGHGSVPTLIKAIERMELDTVMAPLNFRTYEIMCGPGGLIERARARGMGVIAIKATTRGEIKPTAEAYRFTLSQDVDLTIPALKEFGAACEIGRSFKPMSREEQAAFLEHCRKNYDPNRTY